MYAKPMSSASSGNPRFNKSSTLRGLTAPLERRPDVRPPERARVEYDLRLQGFQAVAQPISFITPDHIIQALSAGAGHRLLEARIYGFPFWNALIRS